MTDKITAALAALDKATPGPWDAYHVNDKGLWCVAKNESGVTVDPSVSNATLIAAAPDLVDEVIRLRKIIATLSKRANKLERDGVVRMTAEERVKWLDKQCEELEKRDENICEGYGLERKWFAEAQEAKE